MLNFFKGRGFENFYELIGSQYLNKKKSNMTMALGNFDFLNDMSYTFTNTDYKEYLVTKSTISDF